jgi:septal ring factor EnvC (AmiA/AmiB activator)
MAGMRVLDHVPQEEHQVSMTDEQEYEAMLGRLTQDQRDDIARISAEVAEDARREQEQRAANVAEAQAAPGQPIPREFEPEQPEPPPTEEP